MNKRQKAILQAQLDEEEKIIDEIKRSYERALRQIDSKIAALMGRTDLENLQSIIYQLDYQKALRAEISGILDVMNAEQFTSISEYLRVCYENGFAGTLYDLQGQGIPLIFPIDQEQVVKAVTMNSKISEGLYTRMGHDVTALKKTINVEVSRGIASSLSYAEIARNISSQTGITMNKTIRIARTEGHRIAQEASYNAQVKAKEKGADIVKQWDATLDKRTRRAHTELDGQIREVDKPFEYMGHTAMYAGDFGVASLDINCRCAVLQRAKWALDEDELATLKERAAYYGLDKTKNFDDFKKKYLAISDNDIYNGDKQGMDLQLFAEKDLQKQKTLSLKKGLASFQEQITEHRRKIERPWEYVPDWNDKDAREQEGLKRHWEKEIRTFQQSIENRIAELRKRGEYDE